MLSLNLSVLVRLLEMCSLLFGVVCFYTVGSLCSGLLNGMAMLVLCSPNMPMESTCLKTLLQWKCVGRDTCMWQIIILRQPKIIFSGWWLHYAMLVRLAIAYLVKTLLFLETFICFVVELVIKHSNNIVP